MKHTNFVKYAIKLMCIVCRRKPRIVEEMHRERQNRTQNISRERQGIPVYTTGTGENILERTLI